MTGWGVVESGKFILDISGVVGESSTGMQEKMFALSVNICFGSGFCGTMIVVSHTHDSGNSSVWSVLCM